MGALEVVASAHDNHFPWVRAGLLVNRYLIVTYSHSTDKNKDIL